MDREEERSQERGERVAEDHTAEPVEEDGRAGVEQRVRQMEAPRPEAPELIVDEVREGLQGAVVAALDPLREERVGEDPRDVPPVLDRGVVDDEKAVVPEERVAERVQVDEHGRRHDRTRSKPRWDHRLAKATIAAA